MAINTSLDNASEAGKPRLRKSLKLWQVVMMGLAYLTPMTVFDTFGIVSGISNGHVPASQELGQALVQMARVQIAFLYPDISRLIPDQAAFVQAYLDHHQGGTTPFDDLFAWQAAETAKLSE